VFLTMELHAGGTLSWFLAAGGPLDVDAAAPLVSQILAGVGAAHAAGVVHADLKPSNILLTGADSARVVITDFGLAVPCCASLSCHCSMAHLYGTPAYMAPEQVTGGTLLDTSDVFSLGVILFEMVTGRLPFAGSTAVEMANARLSGTPPSPRTLQPDVDPRWDQAIRACLAVDPRHRPSSIADLAQALALG
jgi:serine/threonine-protein kinase